MRRHFITRPMVILLLMVSTPLSAIALEVGERAPVFEGVSTLGDIRLSDYHGKQHVVLALYFAVFTPV